MVEYTHKNRFIKDLTLDQYYIYNLLYLSGEDRLDAIGANSKHLMYIWSNVMNWYTHICDVLDGSHHKLAQSARHELDNIHNMIKIRFKV